MTTLWGWLRSFGRFWYEFVVGDDWTIAAGVVVALGVTYGILRAGIAAWWLLPLAGAGIVTFAVVRANHAARAKEDEGEADADAPSHRQRHEEEAQPERQRLPEQTNTVGS